MGLGKGGSLENALVVKNNSLMNEGGLRNEKEFVNHKILDCMGDLYLSGYRIIGSLSCSQGGHNLTNKLLRKLFGNQKNYSLISYLLQPMHFLSCRLFLVLFFLLFQYLQISKKF